MIEAAAPRGFRFAGTPVFAIFAPLLIALLVLVSAPRSAHAEVPVPPLTGAVVDTTSTLSAEQIRSLDAELRAFADRQGSQLAVLLVPSARPESIEQFSIRVADKWKIGRKRIDDGVIIVVAKQDREVRIEVGYGLEGAIPDAVAKRVVEERIVPRFRDGDFYGGLRAGAQTLMQLMQGEKLPPPQRGADQGGHLEWIIWVLFALVVLGGAVRSIFGRVLGAVLSGTVVGAVAGLVIGSIIVGVVAGLFAFLIMLATGGGRGNYIGGGPWGGGGWGGGLGGGSWGGGGFGGGGGGFGGGGASGRW